VFGFVGCGGVLVALLLPAIQAAREAARRAQCANNLKQIALAMHNYHDTYKAFPPAYTVDEDGNRLHSWRTIILPFMEQSALYDQIRLDEPWDSAHNAQFSETIISQYKCPSNPGEGPCTNYMVIVGQEAIFKGPQQTSIANVLDGTSNTLMIVEVPQSTTRWMEPVDLEFAEMPLSIDSQGSGMGSMHPGGTQGAWADGSVRFIPETVDAETLRALITCAGGERVNVDF
jgi:prepilin-type processing-associated H-X9-DG protein